MIDVYEGVWVHGGFRDMGSGPHMPGYEGYSSRCYYLGNNNNQSNTSSSNNMTVCYIYRSGHWGEYPQCYFYVANRYYNGGTGSCYFNQGSFAWDNTCPSHCQKINVKSQSTNPGGAHAGQTVTRYEIGLSSGTYTNLNAWIEICFPLATDVRYNNHTLAQCDSISSSSGSLIYFNNFSTP